MWAIDVACTMLVILPMLFIPGELVAVGDSYPGWERVEAGGETLDIAGILKCKKYKC